MTRRIRASEGARDVKSSLRPVRSGFGCAFTTLRVGRDQSSIRHLFGARAPWWTCGEAAQS